MKYIIGLSGGKDSMASTILAHIMKKPVSELVYCREMTLAEMEYNFDVNDRQCDIFDFLKG